MRETQTILIGSENKQQRRINFSCFFVFFIFHFFLGIAIQTKQLAMGLLIFAFILLVGAEMRSSMESTEKRGDLFSIFLKFFF